MHPLGLPTSALRAASVSAAERCAGRATEATRERRKPRLEAGPAARWAASSRAVRIMRFFRDTDVSITCLEGDQKACCSSSDRTDWIAFLGT